MRCLLPLLILFPFIAFSQNNNSSVSAESTIRSLANLRSQNMAQDITPESRVIGDNYLKSDWTQGWIELYKDDERLEDLVFNFEIKQNVFEIKVDKVVKVLDGRRVKQFLVKSISGESLFVNAAAYTQNGSTGLGFYEILTDGEIKLVKKTIVYVKKPDYSVQFNVGSRDEQILKKDVLYCIKDDKVIELENSKKVFIFFDDKSDEIKAFAKAQGLKPNREEDLKQIFAHYNKLKS